MPDFTVPLDLPPGLFSDDTTFAKMGRWATGSNIRFFQGRPETIGGVTTAISNVTQDVNKLLAYTVSGTLNIAIAGQTLERAAIGGSPTDITPASGWNTTSRHCLDMWGDELLASCSGGKLFVSVAGAQATEITQSPDAITCMLVTKTRQVMALGCNEESGGTFNGRCIRFSNIEDYTDWTTSATNNAGEVILPGQQNIVGGCRLGEYIAVWTTGALFLGTFLGDPAQPWDFQRVASIGMEGMDAFAVAGDTVYWISPDRRIFYYMPGGSPTEIPCPISREFEADGAWSNGPANSSASVVVNRRYSEVWFFPPSLVTNAYIYHLNESSQNPVWSKIHIENLIGGTTLFAPAMIDDPLTKTAGVATTMLGFLHTISAGRVIRWVDVAGTAPGSFTLSSADMYIDEARRRVMAKRFVPDFETQSGSVTLAIAAKDRPQSSASSTSYTITTSETVEYFRKSGMIFAFTFSGTSIRCRLGKPTLDCVTIGER